MDCSIPMALMYGLTALIWVIAVGLALVFLSIVAKVLWGD